MRSRGLNQRQFTAFVSELMVHTQDYRTIARYIGYLVQGSQIIRGFERRNI